jgi:Chitinase class I
MASNLAFERKKFFDGYRKKFGGLNQTQVDGLEALLAGIEADPDVTDLRWAAYMLATVKHECANRYQPLEEFGKGKGRKYGSPVKKIIDGVTYNNAYYGRGYVQLTWDYNYKNLGEALGLGEKMLANPSLALDPATAYRIMSYGMRHGTFTTKKLADTISGNKCDYRLSRKIINGLDKAALIAGYAVEFENILRASQVNGSVAAVAPAAPSAAPKPGAKPAAKKAAPKPAPKKPAAKKPAGKK